MKTLIPRGGSIFGILSKSESQTQLKDATPSPPSHTTTAVTGLRDNWLYQACPLCECQRIHAGAMTHQHEPLLSATSPISVANRPRRGGAHLPHLLSDCIPATCRVKQRCLTLQGEKNPASSVPTSINNYYTVTFIPVDASWMFKHFIICSRWRSKRPRHLSFTALLILNSGC